MVWFFVVILGALGRIALYFYTTPQEIPVWLRDWLPVTTQQYDHHNHPLYRWYDVQGHLQVTDHPPQGRPYETVQYHSETHVIPSDPEKNARKQS